MFTLPCFGPHKGIQNANYHEGKFALNFVLPYLNTSKDVVDMCSKENVRKEGKKERIEKKRQLIFFNQISILWLFMNCSCVL